MPLVYLHACSALLELHASIPLYRHASSVPPGLYNSASLYLHASTSTRMERASSVMRPNNVDTYNVPLDLYTS